VYVQWFLSESRDKIVNEQSISGDIKNYTKHNFSSDWENTYYFFARITNHPYSYYNDDNLYVKDSNISSVTVRHIEVVPPENRQPEITQQPARNTTVEQFTQDEVKLSVQANPFNNGRLSYQWYLSTTNNDEEYSGTEVPNANSSEYTVPTDVDHGTYYYYVIVTNSIDGALDASVNSDIAIVTIIKTTKYNPTINTQPTAETTISVRESVTLSVNASAPGSLSLRYRWYKMVDGGAFSSPIEGAENASYEFSNGTAQTDYEFFVRVYTVVHQTEYSIDSEHAIVKVRQNPPKPVISFGGDPVSQTVNIGDTVELNISVNQPSYGELKYQWYMVNQNDNQHPIEILGETYDTLFVVVDSFETQSYYVEVVNEYDGMMSETTKSKEATIQVNGGGIDINGNSGTVSNTPWYALGVCSMGFMAVTFVMIIRKSSNK
jgi:hypothetical protein